MMTPMYAFQHISSRKALFSRSPPKNSPPYPKWGSCHRDIFTHYLSWGLSPHGPELPRKLLARCGHSLPIFYSNLTAAPGWFFFVDEKRYDDTGKVDCLPTSWLREKIVWNLIPSPHNNKPNQNKTKQCRKWNDDDEQRYRIKWTSVLEYVNVGENSLQYYSSSIN